jgi:hypothetical protein
VGIGRRAFKGLSYIQATADAAIYNPVRQACGLQEEI